MPSGDNRQLGSGRTINRRTALKTIGATTALGLAGCSELGGGGSTPNGNGQDGVQTLVMMTTSEDSSAYQISQGIAAVLDEHSDTLALDPRPASGSNQSMARLDRGECDIAYTHALNASNIINSEGPWADQNYENDIYSIFYYYDVIYNLVSRPDSGIDTIPDVEGETLYPLDVGSAARTYLLTVLEEMIDMDSVETVNMQKSAQPDGFSEGRMSVGTDLRLNQIQPGYIEALYARHDLQLVEWTDDDIAVVEDDPRFNGSYRSAADYPGPQYDGRDEAFWLELPYIAFTTGQLGADTVNELLTTIWENIDQMADYHAVAASWTDIEFFGKHLNIDAAPVHEGSQSFFDERL